MEGHLEFLLDMRLFCGLLYLQECFNLDSVCWWASFSSTSCR